MDQSYVVVAGVQIAIVVVLFIVGGILAAKAAPPGQGNAKLMWDIAKTVVIFLPMALAWFAIFSAMFVQAIDLAIPVLVGVAAVGLNFGIDYGVSTGGFMFIPMWIYNKIMGVSK
jgi:hypothetical protein